MNLSALEVQAVDWVAIAPLAIVTVTMLAVLVLQAVWPGRRRLLDAIPLGGLGLAAIALTPLARGELHQTFCLVGGCSFYAARDTLGLQVTVILAAAVTVLLARGERSLAAGPVQPVLAGEASSSKTTLPAKTALLSNSALPINTSLPAGVLPGPNADIVPRPVARPDTLQRAEFWALLLAATTGALALIGARDLFTILIAVEIASLPVVGMVATTRTARSALAATKLLLVSVISFGLALLGVALIYAGTGTVSLAGLQSGARLLTGGDHLVPLGLAFVVAGVGYKVAALPFGLWVPDVYPATPLPVSAFLSSVSKIAGVTAVALVVSALPGFGRGWLAVLVAVTMTLANLVALVQPTCIGMLAWSTIAQAGWALLPLTGSSVTGEVTGAVTTYLMAYAAASLCAFTVVLLVSRHHPASRRHLISDEAGLIRREPVAGALLVLALLSLAGLPPGLAGLIAKVAALRPPVEAGVWWLALVAAVNVALALAYYLRWVWTVVSAGQQSTPTWHVTHAEGAALSLAGGLLVVFTILPGLMT